MTQLITNGIKIAIKTTYNGAIYRNENLFHAFSYYISIENRTKDSVQLLARFWEIYDALKPVEFVSGRGVVGKTPIITPHNFYTYKSNCFLMAQNGAMKGYFSMLNLQNNLDFQVPIPTFQLMAFPLLN